MVHLLRFHHTDTGLVAVSLRRDPGDDRAQIAVPGQVRVVDGQVAERLARVVAIEHARACDRLVQLDLDQLLDRVETDAACPRSFVSGDRGRRRQEDATDS